MSAVPDKARPPCKVPAQGLVLLPMTQPLNADACPCGDPPRVDGFCEEHAGAVAFKVPVAADGEVLPAVDWHWAHEEPCPSGQSWLIRSPSELDHLPPRVWACPHREHQS